MLCLLNSVVLVKTEASAQSLLLWLLMLLVMVLAVRFKYQGKRRAQQGAATPAEPAAAAGYPHEGQSGDEDDCGLFDGKLGV